MTLLAVGTRVRISAQGREQYCYEDDYDPSNPPDLVGVIIDYNSYSSHIYEVDWKNDYTNCYRRGEIEPMIPDVPLTRKDFQEMV